MTKRKSNAVSDIDRDLKWRKAVVSQIIEWAENNSKASQWQGPLDSMALNLLTRRANKLSDWLRMWMPDYWPETISVEDAALLIVLPKPQAFQLARKIFKNVVTPKGHRIGMFKDMQPDDVKDWGWNLDWFRPREA